MANNIVEGIKEIKAPVLNSPDYGENIKKQFENIDINFKRLSRLDYIKGDDGEDVNLVEIILADPKNKIWVDRLKKSIIAGLNNEGLDPIKDKDENIINWDDNFQNNPGKLLLMYKEDKIVSSLAYVYIDPRFYNKITDKLEYNDFSELTDCSRVIFFDKYVDTEPVFKIVESFPTLYYDNEQQLFCWRLWGVETGIPASGPAGKDGISTSDDFKNLIKYLVVKKDVDIIKI